MRPLAVLITQCLQHDFVGLVPAHDPLPNKLHVGPEEALRLLGPDPTRGPVAQLIAWARQQGDLAVIHVRDWHDPADAAQQAHLAAFGAHCVRGSEGAAFVFGASEADEHVVDAIGLNDFEGTTLPEVLAALSPGRPLRVGVVGVWTEAKVTFLLYDLATRLGVSSLATCSALTASASRTQHFNALGQLHGILGVDVFDSVGEFMDWLLPTGAELDLSHPGGFGPRLHVDGAELDEADRDILGYLYREAARVELTQLGGGFSGAQVFRVRSWDAVGHEQAPSVAKLGPRRLIGTERAAFERVEAILGNNAPRVRGFVDLGERAGLAYAYAAMGAGDVRTLKSLVAEGAPIERIEAIVDTVFDEVLGRFYAAAQYEPLPLLEHYGFAPRWAESVQTKVEALTGRPAAAHPLVKFYSDFLANHKPLPEYHYVSIVHGDLNGANVLVDGRENVWVIDWFHAGRAHGIKDLAKLENDLLFLFTPLEEADLPDAVRLTEALRAVEDLRAPLPELTFASIALTRAWRLVRRLRRQIAELVRDDRDPQQLRVALLRYAAHTLSFDEASPVQKRWALAAATGWAEDVARVASTSTRLWVDWLPDLGLGMTLCPGRRDRGRSLNDDLDALRDDGVNVLVTLVTTDELDWLGVSGLRDGCEARGIGHRALPIADQRAPGLEEATELVGWLLAELEAGRRVVLHCMAGLGRTGTVAACALVAQGLSPEAAITAVRGARSPRAIETAEQERFVARFAAYRPT